MDGDPSGDEDRGSEVMKQGVLEIVKDSIYDTLFIPENLVNGRGVLFCIPLGQYAGRIIKQYEHTNVLCAGMLPAPNKFLVQSIHCCILSGTMLIPTADRIWDATFTLESMMKAVLTCPLRDIADDDTMFLIAKEPENTDDKGIHEQVELANAYWRAHRFGETSDETVPEPNPLFFDTCQNFIGRIKFEHPINVPLSVVIALKGLSARAVL